MRHRPDPTSQCFCFDRYRFPTRVIQKGKAHDGLKRKTIIIHDTPNGTGEEIRTAGETPAFAVLLKNELKLERSLVVVPQRSICRVLLVELDFRVFERKLEVLAVNVVI